MHFLGKNLRYLRKQSAKTQSEIASLIQKGQTAIGNWENGISEPSISELLIISNYFEIPLDSLLKVDLSEAQPGQRYAAASRSYDHTPGEIPEAREEDLSYVLQEIKSLRSEMARINLLLPDRKPDEMTGGQPW